MSLKAVNTDAVEVYNQLRTDTQSLIKLLSLFNDKSR